MQTFKQYLVEVWGAGETKRFPFAGKPLLPIFPTIMSRVFGKSKKQLVYHVTDWKGLKGLIDIQKSKKSISTLYENKLISQPQPFSGIETAGGIIVACKGKLLNSTHNDQFSEVDDNGRRWSNIKEVVDGLPDKFEHAKEAYKLLDDLKAFNIKFSTKAKNQILKITKTLDIPSRYKAGQIYIDDLISYMRGYTTYIMDDDYKEISPKDKKILNKEFSNVIKDYIDELEKFMMNNKDLLAILFAVSENDAYEVIVNEVELKAIVVQSFDRYPDIERLDDNTLEIRNKKTNIKGYSEEDDGLKVPEILNKIRKEFK
jgi:hypothetical protein